MNRADEIQAVARTIAEQVNADPEARNKLADQLIELSALIVKAVGKSVAVDAESEMYSIGKWDVSFPEERAEQDAESEKFHGMYLTGEKIQNGARWVQENAVGADLERYEKSGLSPVWTPAAPVGQTDDLWGPNPFDVVDLYPDHHPACYIREGDLCSCSGTRDARTKTSGPEQMPLFEMPVVDDCEYQGCPYDADCPVHGLGVHD